MAKKTTTIAVSSILLVALVGGLLFYQPFSGQVASSAACPSGMVVHQVSNAGSGALSVLCQSGGSGSYTYATCVSNQYVYGNATTGFLCSQIKYDQLAGTLYSTCASGSFATGNGSSTTLPCSSVNYDQLSGSLSCSSGYVLVSISTVATCVPVAETETGTTTLYVDLTNGNDATCTGTSSSPCKTITGALALLPTVLNYATTVCVSNGNDSEAEITFTHFLITASLTIAACTTSNVNLYYNGGGSTVGGSTSTLTDSSASWATNQFAGGRVFVYEGTGAPEFAEIKSNTATAITIYGTWTAPASGSYYTISSGVQFRGSANPQFSMNGAPNSNIYVYGFGFYSSGSDSAIVTENGAVGDRIYYSYFFVAASTTETEATTSAGYGAVYDYFMLHSGSIGVAAVAESTVIPRADAFVSAVAGAQDGESVLCDRVSFCNTINSVGSLDLFYSTVYGMVIENNAWPYFATSQVCVNTAICILWPGANTPSPLIIVGSYPTSSTGVVVKTATVSDAISYTPPSQTGAYSFDASVNVVSCIFCVFNVVATYKDASGAAETLNLICAPELPASTTTATTTTTTTTTVTATLYTTTKTTLTTTSTNNQLNTVTTVVTTVTSTSPTTTSVTTSSTATTQTFTSYVLQTAASPIQATGLYGCSWPFNIDASGTTITLSFDLLEGSASYYPAATLYWRY